MLDLACIFTTGGVILFCRAFCTLKFDVLDQLIKNVLIQDKSGESAYHTNPYVVKWRFANDLNLIFAVIYQEMIQLPYVEEFLEMFRESYVTNLYPKLTIEKNLYKNFPSFEDEFVQVHERWQRKQSILEKKNSTMKTFEQTKKGKELKKKGSEKDEKKPKETPKETPKDTTKATPKQTEDPDVGEKSPESIRKSKSDIREVIQNKFNKNRTSEIKESKEVSEIPAKKESRQWDIRLGGSTSKRDTEMLDVYSSMKNRDEEKQIEQQKSIYLGEDNVKLAGFKADDDLDSSSDEEDDENSKPKKLGLFSKLKSSIKNITGNKVITDDEISEIMAKFKEDLMIKNVAEEISQKLCDSIKTTLIDKKTKAFTSLSKTVKETMQESLTKILTPKRQVDIISEALRAKERGKPYVLVFIGVNGVGKSTNLAKVAYLYKQQGFSVMLAACDNFRSGAVEQLKTHGRCLDVPVYDRGYKEDPAEIARKAIKEAIATKTEVLLIDTAGRMQDNEPLMKALSRLVHLNQPDLIVFIGEALVGNDAVDQLTKFNNALIDLSPKDNVREIDGIILSKFDTVDEKVGAAISMTYSTGKPILFVGVGQKYPHLRKLNAKTVVHALLN